MIFPYIIWLFVLPIIQTPASRMVEKIDLDVIFHEHGVEGSFVLLDKGKNKLLEYRPDRCHKGFLPKSTFKIPHALIALEEGILKDENQVISWDGTIYPVEDWNRDQTLSTAIQYSCVWFFSELTRMTDLTTYKKYLEKFNYGNQEVIGPPSLFWLSGKLRISALQQVEFLDRFYDHNLGISDRSIDVVKKLILLEKKEDYALYGKTGGGTLNGNKNIMWLVGFVEKQKCVYFFALNFISDEFDQKTASARMEITRSVLQKMGII